MKGKDRGTNLTHSIYPPCERMKVRKKKEDEKAIQREEKLRGKNEMEERRQEGRE